MNTTQSADAPATEFEGNRETRIDAALAARAVALAESRRPADGDETDPRRSTVLLDVQGGAAVPVVLDVRLFGRDGREVVQDTLWPIELGFDVQGDAENGVEGVHLAPAVAEFKGTRSRVSPRLAARAELLALDADETPDESVCYWQGTHVEACRVTGPDGPASRVVIVVTFREECGRPAGCAVLAGLDVVDTKLGFYALGEETSNGVQSAASNR